MSEIIEKLIFYFSYPFVRYALIVGILIAISSSILGVTLVLKRFSFIGDGLSHVAFGVMAIASVLNLSNDMFIVLPGTAVAAIFILSSNHKAKLKGDAQIAMLSVGALAFGYLIMNVFSTAPNISGDVCSSLFGSTSILTLTRSEVVLCIVLSLVIIALFVIFYNRIFALTFDENFAKAVGTNVVLYNFMLALMISVIIVLAMNLVGSLLISALIIFPPLSAMRIKKSFLSVTITSSIISVISTVFGILLSILASTPVGSTIVVIDILAFFISIFLGRVLN